jgi:hypothetical protein
MTLIERLRDTASKGISAWGDLQVEAADELEHLTEMVEQLIVGAVACVEVVVENERLFSENKLLNFKLEEEQKKTAENESLQRCLAYWQNLYSQQSKELYELEQKK